MPDNINDMANERVTAVPAFSDNYSWLLHSSNATQVAIVDPGDAGVVIDALTKLSLTPCAILITHHDHDHISGILEVLMHFQVPVYGSALGNIPGLTHPLTEGDHITLDNGLAFSIMATPGHTNDHICYVSSQTLLSGDTLFAGGCGRLREGTAKQLYESLAKIRALPEQLKVYCGHEYTLSNLRFALEVEPNNQALKDRYSEVEVLRKNKHCTLPTTLAIEKQTNPFLRWDQPAIITSVEKFAGRSLKNGSDVFAVLRYWKDTF